MPEGKVAEIWPLPAFRVMVSVSLPLPKAPAGKRSSDATPGVTGKAPGKTTVGLSKAGAGPTALTLLSWVNTFNSSMLTRALSLMTMILGACRA